MSRVLKGVLAVLGVVSTLIALFAFVTGNETLPELLGRETKVTIPSSSTVGVIICSGGAITELENGTNFDVIDGPRCKGSIVWWQARANNGQTGWIAEYDNKDYLVAPSR
jgi:hypothetical protein